MQFFYFIGIAILGFFVLSGCAGADAVKIPEWRDDKGMDIDGFDAKGFNIEGYDRSGFDKSGCDRDGKNHLGIACSVIKKFDDDDRFDGYDNLKQENDKNAANVITLTKDLADLTAEESRLQGENSRQENEIFGLTESLEERDRDLEAERGTSAAHRATIAQRELELQHERMERTQWEAAANHRMRQITLLEEAAVARDLAVRELEGKSREFEEQLRLQRKSYEDAIQATAEEHEQHNEKNGREKAALKEIAEQAKKARRELEREAHQQQEKIKREQRELAAHWEKEKEELAAENRRQATELDEHNSQRMRELALLKNSNEELRQAVLEEHAKEIETLIAKHDQEINRLTGEFHQKEKEWERALEVARESAEKNEDGSDNHESKQRVKGKTLSAKEVVDACVEKIKIHRERNSDFFSDDLNIHEGDLKPKSLPLTLKKLLTWVTSTSRASISGKENRRDSGNKGVTHANSQNPSPQDSYYPNSPVKSVPKSSSAAVGGDTTHSNPKTDYGNSPVKPVKKALN